MMRYPLSPSGGPQYISPFAYRLSLGAACGAAGGCRSPEWRPCA